MQITLLQDLMDVSTRQQAEEPIQSGEIAKRGMRHSFRGGGGLGKHKKENNSWVPLGFKEAISLHFLLSMCVSEETEK